jgi:hypothetical protein
MYDLRAWLRLEWGDYPLTPGRLIYLLKLKFGHGPRVAWYRDVVRPRILGTGPVLTAATGPCEIHVLTSAGDWLNLLWSLKSFYRYSGRDWPLCIHDDGTLSAEASRSLRAAFPGARLVSRPEADGRVQPLLADFPRSQAFRATNPLAPKVFDFHAFLEAERMMIFDSDILFFARPTALLSTVESAAENSLNKDWRAGYTIEPATASGLSFPMPPLINSGLGLIHRGSLRLDWIEEFLALPGVLSHPHQIEQTLIALCSARFGFSMLPAEYDVYTGPLRAGVPCRHYAGPTRHLMYGEGIRLLSRQGFLSPTK